MNEVVQTSFRNREQPRKPIDIDELGHPLGRIIVGSYDVHNPSFCKSSSPFWQSVHSAMTALGPKGVIVRSVIGGSHPHRRFCRRGKRIAPLSRASVRMVASGSVLGRGRSVSASRLLAHVDCFRIATHASDRPQSLMLRVLDYTACQHRQNFL